MKRTALLAAAVAVVAVLAWKIWSGRRFFYAGTVEATEVDISARLSSVIDSFPAVEGRPVRAGQTLVALACEDERLAAALARKDYERAATLRRTGSIPREAYDRAENVRDEAELRLSWCDIRAPLDATVLATYHEPGELVGPGTKLLTLADLDEVWAMIYAPQPVVAGLRLDMEVSASAEGVPGRTFQGRISLINQEAEFTPKNVQTRQERTRLVYGVKVRFPNPDNVLKPGMTVEVRLPD